MIWFFKWPIGTRTWSFEYQNLLFRLWLLGYSGYIRGLVCLHFRKRRVTNRYRDNVFAASRSFRQHWCNHSHAGPQVGWNEQMLEEERSAITVILFLIARVFSAGLLLGPFLFFLVVCRLIVVVSNHTRMPYNNTWGWCQSTLTASIYFKWWFLAVQFGNIFLLVDVTSFENERVFGISTMPNSKYYNGCFILVLPSQRAYNSYYTYFSFGLLRRLR